MEKLPSHFLPQAIRTQSLDSLQDALNKLDKIVQDDLEPLERDYASDWLTRLLSTCEDEDLLEKAASLLSSYTTPRSSVPNIRTFSFSSTRGDVQIELQETDMQDVNATGFCTWSSASVLARRILADPSAFFGLPQSFCTSTVERKLRILEVGSGTGLAGIATLSALSQSEISADVILTDYDDRTLDTLRRNVERHIALQKLDNSVTWEIQKLAWEDPSSMEEHSFDIIIGSDIVYEREHPALLYNLVKTLLSREGIFHLVVPVRYTHQADIDDLERLFSSESLSEPMILEKEDIEKDSRGQYPHRYYRIG